MNGHLEKSTRLAELRAQAEKRLEEEMDSRGLTPEEATRLIHELRTHQIELEMQNVELRHAQEELLEARDKYSNLYDFTPVGCLTFSESGTIIEANLTAATMLLTEKAKLMQSSFSSFICSDSQDSFYFHRREILSRKIPEKCELHLQRQDGSRFWAELKSCWLEDAQGEFRGCWQTALTDISDRKLAEEEKARLEAQLRHVQKLETLGTLAGGIAHDFNNILSPLIGYLDLAIHDLDWDDRVRDKLGHALSAALRAADLVKQILMFSGRAEKERKPLDLADIVKDAVKLLRATVPSTVEIITNVNSANLRLKPIYADQTQMHQMIMNLGTNAYHAMENMGGVLEITLDEILVDDELIRSYSYLRKGRWLRLMVEDKGCGMDQDTKQRIFDPFYTNRAIGKGSGLGLSVVHGIVSSHGGEIAVESKLDAGTIFCVYLPQVDSEVKDELKEKKEIPCGGERVLVVDDEPTIAAVQKQLLERLGYKVDTFSSSSSALEAFCADPKKYDLVISDQTMPQLTGLKLAEELTRIRSDIPIILTSGYSEILTPENLRNAGICRYLRKPLKFTELGVAVREVLDHRGEISQTGSLC